MSQLRLTRRTLLVAGGAVCLPKVSLISRSMAATAEDTKASLSDDVERQLVSIMSRAGDLGASVPVAAGDRDLESISADLADLMVQLLSSPEDQPELREGLLTEAGLLLSQVNRAKREDALGAVVVAAPSFADLASEYKGLFTSAKVSSEKVAHLERAARTILRPQSQQIYRLVEKETNIPWYVVASLHYRESSLNFLGHLHNGDPLRLKTVQEPRYRPKGVWPPNPWEPTVAFVLSAKDALDKIPRPTKWTVERMLYVFEGYNGWGYRSHPGYSSPYLWNFTQYYAGGGFPKDHVWSDTYRSKQAGLASMIVTLARLAPNELALSFE
jgi:lysozyme family protein